MKIGTPELKTKPATKYFDGGYVSTSIGLLNENVFQYVLVGLIIGMIPMIIIATRMKTTINNEATE